MSLATTLRLILTTFTAVCMVSCGGGGSGSGGSSSGNSSSSNVSASNVSVVTPPVTSSPVLKTLTGNFIDSAVSGLGYKTSTQKGTTDSQGSFVYVEGEKITFSIGAITFPPIQASSTLTPLSMSATNSLSDPVVTNVAYLLQSLDANNDPADGLVIDSRVAALATSNLNFNQSPTSFAVDPTVTALITATDKLKTSPTTMTPDIAIANLSKTLIGLLDSSSIPSPGCDQINSQIVSSRVSYSTNFWATVIAKPVNTNGFVYGGAFRNVGAIPAGSFIWYQPSPTSNEVLIAQKSGQWDPAFSSTYDIWLKHSENSNIVMRIAVAPLFQETTDTPKYVGSAIYLIYTGAPGTYLDFQFEQGNVPAAFFSYIGNAASSFYTGTAGIDGVLGDADDGYFPSGFDQIWLQHVPGQPNFPPNMHTGGTTPYGRVLGATKCFLNPSGSVQLWGSPSTTADLLFSPTSSRNFWGQDAPMYTDTFGYKGAMGIRAGVQAVSVVKSN